MSARAYNTVGVAVAGVDDGFAGSMVNMAGGGTLLDGAVADDTDGKRYVPTGIPGGDVADAIRYTTDGIIPPNSSINSVVMTNRMRGRVVVGGFYGYTRLDGQLSTDLWVLLGGGVDVWTSHATTFLQTPYSNPWTPTNIFQATFGVQQPTIQAANVEFEWSWTYITINFDLSPPVITTGIATGITLTQATLQGTINPNFANATYPCAYYFEYGLTTAYGAVTGTVNNLTGSADIAATGTAVDLLPSTDYHFRLVGTNADHTILGADATFRTRDLAFPFWQDEFHPTDGTLDTKALVRWESVGFDLSSDILDCPILDRDAT